MDKQEIVRQINKLLSENRECFWRQQERERMVGHLIYSKCSSCNIRNEQIRKFQEILGE